MHTRACTVAGGNPGGTGHSAGAAGRALAHTHACTYAGMCACMHVCMQVVRAKLKEQADAASVYIEQLEQAHV